MARREPGRLAVAPEPLLREFLAETGVRVLPKQAWTDVATLQAHGIPAVNYGPGEPHQAHQPGEWVDGEAIARVATTLARFLGRQLRGYGCGHAPREVAGARQPLPAVRASRPGRSRRRARGCSATPRSASAPTACSS